MVFVYKGVRFRWSFRRFLVNSLVCSLILLISSLYMTNAAKATSDNKASAITVRSGQTLWSIARQIAPEKDPRDVIIMLKQANNLRNSNLTVGQTLKTVKLD